MSSSARGNPESWFTKPALCPGSFRLTLARGMFHFGHLLVEGVHRISQHFCLLCPVVNGIHFPPKGVKKADLTEAAITVQNPPVIHVTLNITPLLSRSGLGIDSYVVVKGVTVCGRETRVRRGDERRTHTQALPQLQDTQEST